MSDAHQFEELVQRLTRSSALSAREADHLIEEVLAFLDESIEQFVRRRHAELQRAGLIDVRREGRFLYYRPNFTHMNQLIGFLTENCCVLADEGCGTQCGPAPAESALVKRRRA